MNIQAVTVFLDSRIGRTVFPTECCQSQQITPPRPWGSRTGWPDQLRVGGARQALQACARAPASPVSARRIGHADFGHL